MKKKIFILMLMCGFALFAKSQTVADYNLLIVNGTLGSDAQSELTAMGHTVVLDDPSNLTPGYDYTPYDAIIFMYNTALPSGMSEILALNQNCQLGIILMRSENIISSADIGTSVTFSGDDFIIENNTHYITQPFSLGLLDLGFTYKSNLTTINSGNTILGSVSGGNGSLVIHDTYKRVISPYYGHTAGMPWTPDAEILMDRIIAWAVSPCCTANTGIDVITACNSHTWIDGNTYMASNNTATHTLTNAAGCDSLVTLNLTINHSNTGVDTRIECDSYVWIDGNTYIASNNTATHTLANAAGCDSLITLNLTINHSNTGVDTRIECDSYVWIDGNTYTTSNNTATHTLTNVAGCDSVVTLNLTINSVTDITTTLNGLSIIANNGNATYQWLDCNNNYSIINGEINPSFTATSNGNYAVELSENGCRDTSACVSITTVGILENNFGNEFKIYPNPTYGNFSIDLGDSHNSITVKITDLYGKLIQSKEYSNSHLLNLKIDEPAGVYLLIIESTKNKAIVRLVKE